MTENQTGSNWVQSGVLGSNGRSNWVFSPTSNNSKFILRVEPSDSLVICNAINAKVLHGSLSHDENLVKMMEGALNKYLQDLRNQIIQQKFPGFTAFVRETLLNSNKKMIEIQISFQLYNQLRVFDVLNYDGEERQTQDKYYQESYGKYPEGHRHQRMDENVYKDDEDFTVPYYKSEQTPYNKFVRAGRYLKDFSQGGEQRHEEDFDSVSGLNYRRRIWVDHGRESNAPVALTQIINGLANGSGNVFNSQGINELVLGKVCIMKNEQNPAEMLVAAQLIPGQVLQWIEKQAQGINEIINQLRGQDGYHTYFEGHTILEVNSPEGVILGQLPISEAGRVFKNMTHVERALSHVQIKRKGQGAHFIVSTPKISFFQKISDILTSMGVPYHMDGALINAKRIPKEHCILYAIDQQLQHNNQFIAQIQANNWQNQWLKIRAILQQKLCQDLSVGATDLDGWFGMRITQLNSENVQNQTIMYENGFEKYKRIQFKYQYYKENLFGSIGIDMGKLKPFQLPQVCLAFNHYFSQEKVMLLDNEVNELNQIYGSKLNKQSIQDALDLIAFFYYHDSIEFSQDQNAFFDVSENITNECVEACQERPSCLQKIFKNVKGDDLKEGLMMYDMGQQRAPVVQQCQNISSNVIQIVDGKPYFKTKELKDQICAVPARSETEQKFIFSCDTETTIYDKNLTIENGIVVLPAAGPVHQLRMICSQRLKYDDIQFGNPQFYNVYNKDGIESAQQCIMQWILMLLESIKPEISQTTKSIVLELWFHNLAYDAAVIVSQMQKFGVGGNTIMKGAKIWQMQFTLPKSDTANLADLIAFDKYDVQLSMRDSYKIITMPVKSMPTSFKYNGESLQTHKEIYPYNSATKQMFEEQGGKCSLEQMYLIESTLQQQVSSKIDYTLEDFRQSAIKAQAIQGDIVDMVQYTLYYCQIDVDILRTALVRFHVSMKSSFNINPLEFLSISSLAQQIQTAAGCFANVYASYGVVQQFIQHCAVGGRTMCAQNRQQRNDCIYVPDESIHELKTPVKDLIQRCLDHPASIGVQGDMLQDFDGVSLYPSSMSRVYYPAGIAQYLAPNQIEYFNNPQNLFHITEQGSQGDQALTLFLRVHILNAATTQNPQGSNGWKNLRFPLLSIKNTVTGSRYFTNYISPDYDIYLSHIALQDVVTFQNAQYQILEGFYYTERNYNIQNVITQMFQMRLQAKSENNTALSTLLKLLMNSGYGKLLQKPTNTKTISLSSVLNKEQRIEFRNNIQLDYNELINANQNTSKSEREIIRKLLENINLAKVPIRRSLHNYRNLGNKEFVDYTDPINNNKNLAQCGVMVLDMSKRIMNEVMTTAEELNIPILYQDTDSMHITSKYLSNLQQAYRVKYGRDLIGKKMGQFHSDFDSDSGEVLGAINTICLAKKVYCDNLLVLVQCDQSGRKDQNGKYYRFIQEQHIRFKGITTEAISNIEGRVQLISPRQTESIEDLNLKSELQNQIQELINKHNERQTIFNGANMQFRRVQIPDVLDEEFMVFIPPEYPLIPGQTTINTVIELYDHLSRAKFGMTIDLAWSGRTIMGKADDKLSKVTLSSFKRTCQFYVQMSDEDVFKAYQNGIEVDE